MDAMFGGPGGPTHLLRAAGCRVWTADGRELLDWTMALGAVSLGYGHPAVTEAVLRAVRDGAVGPLPPTLEVRVAERLTAVYPGAGQARFFKTGAEAVQAAVRVARLATGREAIVHCGYHGWLDGATIGPGVPAPVSRLWRAVPFDDPGALEAALAEPAPAALVLEPVIERAPSPAWLAEARRLTLERGIVLVFDEIKTAFRLATGGAAARWGASPDLAVLGKALANGFPLAALVGRADLMARVRETWISSTLATEAVALAAADAVLDVWEREDVAAHLGRIGRMMMDGLAAAYASDGVVGLPEMWLLRFADGDVERRFLLAAAGRGVLIKRGAYNFPSLAHDEAAVRASLDAARAALDDARS
jgi:glutamate-1-semialdehyde aminotransferase